MLEATLRFAGARLRPLLGLSVSCLYFSCSATPSEVALVLPDACREGGTVPITSEVKDKNGHPLALPIEWKVSPVKAATIENGTVRCLAEGEAEITGTAGAQSTTRKLEIRSPLTGTWLRQGDDLAGMRLRVSPGTKGLAAYIVSPPNDEAMPSIQRANSPLVVDLLLACIAHVWTPGLRKWQDVQRLDSSRWSLSDLHKGYSISTGRCREQESKSRYEEDFELKLLSDSRVEVRNLKIGKDPVVWNRVEDVDDARIAAQRTSCDTARGTARKVWKDAVGQVVKAREAADGRFWAGNGSLEQHRRLGRLAMLTTVAQNALANGAYETRRQAREVPTDTEFVELASAVAASETTFKECNDVAP